MKKRMEPSKLDSSKLKFDILQTERIENERMRIKVNNNIKEIISLRKYHKYDSILILKSDKIR